MASKPKSTGASTSTAAPKPENANTAAPAQPANAATAQNGDGRARNFLSPQKALAIAIAGLVAILGQENIAALLTDEQKDQIKAANEMADKLNSQTIKPVQDEIVKVRAALTALTANPDELIKPENVTKVKEYATTLARLQKRLETFTGAATHTV